MSAPRRLRRIATGALLSVGVLGGLVAVGAAPTVAQVSPPSSTLLPWGASTPMTEARTRFGAVYGNGYLYVAGGINAAGATIASTSFARVNADGTLGGWTPTTPLPGPRRTVRPAYSNGYLYLAGGNDGTTYRAEVYRAAVNADGTLGAWTATTPLPVAQTSHSTIASGGFLYVVGGNNGSTCVSTVRYAPINADGSLGAWATTSAMPGNRCGNVEAVTIAGGYMYAAGGYNNVSVTGTVFSAPVNPNGTLGAWQTSPNTLATAREYNAVEAVNGYLYVIGGQPALTGQSTTSVEVAALTAGGGVGPFTSTTGLPGPRSEAASEVVNGRLYAIGGGTAQSGGNPQATVFVTSQALSGDSTPPAVAVTAPAAGSTLSGPVTVTADATDDTGVAGVQLLLDGNPLGAEDTAAPYTADWDTTGVVNGVYTLSARARDGGGNQTTSAPVVVAVANQPSPPVVAYGLEQGSGTAATDSSVNANHATLTGGTWTAGRYGNAITFDGASRLRANANLTLGPGFTYQAWILNPANGAYETILTVGRNRDLYLAGGVPTFWSGGGEASFGAALPTNTWTHLALTYDGTTLRAYVNGAPYGTAVDLPIATTTDALQVGAWMNGAANDDYFSGTLDEVRVYNRALTQAEIQADLATPIAPPPPADTTPPTVAVLAPAAGSTLSGPVTVSVDSTDDTAVAGVQVLLDGNPLGAEDSAAPYTAAWDTTAVVNGLYTLSARARDAAGNQTTSAPVVVAVANQASPAVVAYGLDQGSGDIAIDSSAGGNHANLTGGTWTTGGRYGNAITFDGTTLRAGSDLTLGPSFTFEAWVLNPANGAYETILTVGADRDLYLAGGVPTLWTGGADLSFGAALPTDTWTHVALTYDGTTLRAYVNGVPYGDAAIVSLAGVTGPLQIGAWVNGTSASDYFSGTIDEVRVYDRALTQTEIQADLATPVG